MSDIPLRSGDFVWTYFPYESTPDVPGPIRHAACVVAVFGQRDAGIATPAPVPSRGLVVGVYTSSQVEGGRSKARRLDLAGDVAVIGSLDVAQPLRGLLDAQLAEGDVQREQRHAAARLLARAHRAAGRAQTERIFQQFFRLDQQALR